MPAKESITVSNKDNMCKILKSLRKSEKLSQYEMADLINRSQGSYSDIERGKTEPDIDTLCILADHYHCSIDYLVGRENEDTIVTIQGAVLNKEEQFIIDKYRNLPLTKRQALLSIVNSLDD